MLIIHVNGSPPHLDLSPFPLKPGRIQAEDLLLSDLLNSLLTNFWNSQLLNDKSGTILFLWFMPRIQSVTVSCWVYTSFLCISNHQFRHGFSSIFPTISTQKSGWLLPKANVIVTYSKSHECFLTDLGIRVEMPWYSSDSQDETLSTFSVIRVSFWFSAIV